MNNGKYRFEQDTEENPSVFLDIVKGVGRGVEDAGKSIYDLVDTVGELATDGDFLPDVSDDSVFGEAKTTAGHIAEGITQFATTFIPVAGWVGKASKALKLGKVAASVVNTVGSGFIADFIGQRGNEGRLSDLIESFPELSNPITQYLASDEDDSELEGRLKNALEGAGLGIAFDGLLKGLKWAKSLRKYHTAAPAAEVANKAAKVNTKAAIKEAQKASKAEALSSLSDELADITTDKISKVGRDNLATVFPKGDPRWEFVEDGEDIKILHEALAEKITKRFKDQIAGSERTRLMKEAGAVIKEAVELFDLPDAALKDFLKETEKGAIEVGARSVAGLYLYKGALVDALDASKQYVKNGNKANAVLAISKIKRARAILEMNRRIGSAQSIAFNSRKAIKAAINADEAALTKVIREAGGNKEVTRVANALLMARDDKAATEMLKTTVGERLKHVTIEYWIQSILSGVKTQAMNLIGNLGTTIYLPLEGIVGAAARADAKSIGVWARHYIHLTSALSDAAKFAFRALKEGAPILNSTGKLEGSEFGIRKISAEYISGGTKTAQDGLAWAAVDFVGKLVNVPGRLLVSTDEFFKQLNYRASLKTKLYSDALNIPEIAGDPKLIRAYVDGQMEKLILKSGKKMSYEAVFDEAYKEAQAQGMKGIQALDYAETLARKRFKEADNLVPNASFADAFANETTFTRELDPKGIGSFISQLTRRFPMMSFVVPFVRTPVNIIRFFGERVLPVTDIAGIDVPLIKSIHKRAAEDMLSGDPLRMSMARGRLAMGASMFVTFAELASRGLITGKGPRDPRENAVWREAGVQPYAIKVGDQWLSYQRLDPFASFVGTVADLVEMSRRGDMGDEYEKAALMVVFATLNNVTNKTYLEGLARLFAAIENPEDQFVPALRQTAAGFVPSFIAQMSKTIGDDPYMREARTVVDAMANRVPGLSRGLAPKRNILGEPVDARIALGGPEWDFVNPIMASPAKDDKVFAELATLNHGFTQPRTKWNGVDFLDYINASGQSAYDRMLELIGQVRIKGKTVRQALERVINSREYQKLPKGEAGDVSMSKGRIAMINAVLTKYREEARNRVLREFPELRAKVRENIRLQTIARRGAPGSIAEAPSDSPGSKLKKLL